MKALKAILCLLLIIFSQATFSQKLKFLKKADTYYAGGSYAKAIKTLNKFKSSIPKTGGGNYLAAYYIREARYNLAQGILVGFDASLNNAITSSASAVGENSVAHGAILLDVASIYNDYGNYRMTREYISKAKTIIEAAGEMNSVLKLRIALIETEAMIEQGFCNEALSILRANETLFAQRAVEKETYTENDQIKTRRVPEEELAQRFGDYAQCLMLIGAAYSKKGSLISADSAFAAVDGWLRGKIKYLGETNTVGVENRYRWANYMIENGNTGSRPKDLQLDGILNDLKRRVNPTNELAHQIYLTYLEELMFNDGKAKYQNVKSEYQKVLDKYFPKTSLLRINMQAVEFNSKLNRDKTKDLETEALAVLHSKTLPKNYKTTLRILYFLKDVALAERKYANAESYLNQIVDASGALYGDTSPQYHLTRIYLANFYLDFTNKIDEANKIYAESYKGVVEKEIDFRHKDILEILNHLATIYELTDQYVLASKTLKQASDASIQKYRDDDILYGIELTNIAKLGLKLGDYDKVDKDIKKALEVIDLKHNRDYVEYEPAYVDALETQAKLYGTFGLFDEATANLERSRRIIAKSKTAISNELSSAEELTGLLIQLGRYSDADKLLDNLFLEYEKLYGQNSIRLIMPLVERGRILLAKGEYPEAERTALRANDIAIKSFGDASTKAAPTQKLLSDIYYTLGDYEKAEDNITKALTSQEKQFGRNHIEVGKSLAQLALIKFYKGDNRKQVEQLMLESRDIMASKLGNQNPQYAEVLKNVAVFYISEKQFEIAFSALSSAEHIWLSKTGSKNNINLASIYVLTGDVYYQQRNFKKAEEYYNKSKDLYEKFFSTRHPEYVKVLSKLSRVNYMQKNYKASKRMIEESLGNYEQFIQDYFPALSEREKAKYWNTIKGDFEFYNTLAFSNLDDFKDLTGKIYNYQLLTKALLLSSSIKIRERIMNSTDEALKEKYKEWVDKKERLTLALSMTPEQLMENEIEPATLQQEVERLEKDLSERSEDFGQTYEKAPVRFDMVAKSLNENEVAIEMVRYRYFDHVFTDSIIYAALYLKKDFSRPKAIIFKDGRKMETRYFKYYRNAITGLIPDKVSYDVFWAPIYREIGLASSIYLSGDGVYNQINLEAIPTPDGRYVIDNSNIILVSNTRDLYFNKRKSKLSSPENTASMFGNPTFYLTASADATITALPGTEKEVAQLQYMLKQKGWNTTEFVEGAASEEQVKELNSPKIFHIATHGLYKPSEEMTLAEEIQGNEAMLTQNPLMRTGLLLKGAGDLLSKTDFNYNMDNGILTAYEAMSLNLDKTDLVVLSACETGLGDVEQGEGVYGLQRAFLVAGAKVLIMSMFKVDDEATQKLMLKFYQKWLNSNKLRQSFTDAKKELRNEYPEPIYWGAFMMIGMD
ncbi:MAG TPA: CHAT domain-containing tetratricopeptide repeat protein [Cyclobacteriaceae bacterium]|nr:CHAT domain-containing tetratricopeptide repeat protein [Cyclobacteriaceae bacterium]